MSLEFKTLFPTSKPIIGMIHLAGSDRTEKVERALEELAIYDRQGIDGAILEDYHGDPQDVYETLKRSFKAGLSLVRGVNVLRNSYSAFGMAQEWGARFVQFDSVQPTDLNEALYAQHRREYPTIAVLGGVRFKGTSDTGNPLPEDLKYATARCEAIVTTGSATGVETPLVKLREFRGYLKDFPLIIGAGVTKDNVRQQLEVADGAIVGSYFKPEGNTQMPVNQWKVKEFMNIVRSLRQ